MPLLMLILIAGCAGHQPAQSSDRIGGIVTLSGTDQPLAGVRVVLVPTEGDEGDEGDAGENKLGDYASEATTNEYGAFAFDTLDGVVDGPLVRGWTYRLRTEAQGLHGGEVTFEFEGGPQDWQVQMQLDADDSMAGQQFQELSSESINSPSGTLIREVLRQQGRLPRE
jgi:hypothetical protein